MKLGDAGPRRALATRRGSRETIYATLKREEPLQAELQRLWLLVRHLPSITRWARL
jgi:hypothetical protein